MPDIFSWWGQDLRVSASGDLLDVEGELRGQQRIIRRLLTNPGSYIWHPEYGAGLPRYIGQNLDVGLLRGLITSQMYLEESVVQSPPPVIDIQYVGDGIVQISITYQDAQTGKQVHLSFDVNSQGGA
jgi:phage baseplate assembly protein W